MTEEKLIEILAEKCSRVAPKGSVYYTDTEAAQLTDIDDEYFYSEEYDVEFYGIDSTKAISISFVSNYMDDYMIDVKSGLIKPHWHPDVEDPPSMEVLLEILKLQKILNEIVK